MFDFILKTFLLVSMIFYIPNHTAYGVQEAFIQYSAMLFLGLSFLVPMKRQIENKWLCWFLVYALINTIFFNWDDGTRKILLNLMLGALLFKVIAERVNTDLKIYSGMFLLFVLLNYFFLFLQLYEIDPVFSGINPLIKKLPDYVGVMGVSYALGAVGCFALPFLFSRNALLPILLLPMIYFGKSSSIVLAFGMAYMFMLYFKNRKIFYYFSGLTLLAVIYYVVFVDAPDGLFMKRINVWLAGIAVWKDKLWFGHGLGAWNNFKFISQQQNGAFERWQWAHNEYLQLGLELGVVGLALAYGTMKKMLENLRVRENSEFYALLIILGIISALHFPFHVGRFAGISIFYLALVSAQKADQYDY